MKTHYCDSCGMPVIQAELDRHIGAEIEGKVFCYQCAARKEGKTVPPAPKGPAPQPAAVPAAGIPAGETSAPPEVAPPAAAAEPAPSAAAGPVAAPETEGDPHAEDATASEPVPAPEDTAETKAPSPAQAETSCVPPSPKPASVSSRRRAAMGGGSGASSRRRKQAEAPAEGEEGAPEGPVPFMQRPLEYRLKVLALSASAFMVLLGFTVFLFRGGCHMGEEGKVNVHRSALSQTMFEARTLKQEGQNLYNKGQFAEALDKLFAAQDKYIEVLDSAEKGLTPEDIKQGFSFDYIHDEYSSIPPLIRMASEEKLKKENRESGLYK